MQPLEPYRSHLVTHQRDEGARRQPRHGRRAHGRQRRVAERHRPRHRAGEVLVVQSKKSIDQYIADKIAEDTPLRSLQVGTEDMGTSAGACDGYPCVFFNTISWRDDTSPLPVAINPRVTFERMFGEAGSTRARLANMRRKQSLLDSVAEEASRMRRSARPGRQRHPRRVPDQHPRRRAAARSDGDARGGRRPKARWRRSACRTTSTTT